MDLDANCSTRGANGALAEIVAKHIPEAYTGPAAQCGATQLVTNQWISAARRCSTQGEVSIGAFCIQNHHHHTTDIVIRSPWATLYYGWRVGFGKSNCHCNRIRGEAK